MSFTESNTVEIRLHKPLEGGRITGLGWHYVAPVDRHLIGVRFGLAVGRGRQLQ